MTTPLDSAVPDFAPALCWWEMPADEYDVHVHDLEAWVRQFARFTRVPAAMIPPCWPEHPDLVWLWGALRDYAAFAFHPVQMSSESVGFVRAWQTIASELREATANIACSANQHQDRPAAAWVNRQTAAWVS